MSVVVLCLNESERIARCIRSLSFADRVIVLDSFSTDGTLDQVQKTWSEMGRPSSQLVTSALVWKGFTATRNISLEWVKTPWVLWVDADEWVSPELARELGEVVSRPINASTPALYRMPRQSYFLGRAIRHGGWYPDRKARLGRVGACSWSSGPNHSDVHEDLHPVDRNLSVGLLKGHLEHEPFRDTREQNETNDRYSTLLAEGLARRRLESGKHEPGMLYIGIKTLIKFVENYLFKLGFLDGRAGYLIAKGSSKSLWMRLHKTRAIMLKQMP